MSWNDAKSYAQWLSRLTGKRYRLASESEWEYAARAGSTTAYSFGAFPFQIANFAWYEHNSDTKTHPVGEKRANQFGLHDMHGNVWEWVEDCGVDDYANAPTNGSAAPQQNYCDRVFRGGSWVNNLDLLRSANRFRYPPDYRFSGLGFRVATTLP